MFGFGPEHCGAGAEGQKPGALEALQEQIEATLIEGQVGKINVDVIDESRR